MIFFSTLTTSLLDFELIWLGEIMSLSFMGVKGLIFHVADDSRCGRGSSIFDHLA